MASLPLSPTVEEPGDGDSQERICVLGLQPCLKALNGTGPFAWGSRALDDMSGVFLVSSTPGTLAVGPLLTYEHHLASGYVAGGKLGMEAALASGEFL